MFKIRSNKLKAYTVIELIIVLLVSSLLILSLWLAYGFVYKRFNDFKHTQEGYESLMAFDNLLRKDFNNSVKITSAHGKSLDMLMKDGLRINYIFEENVIIRSANNQGEYFYFNVTQKVFDYLYLDYGMTSNISSFKLELFMRGRVVELIYLKDYDRHFYLNIRQ